MPLERSPGLRAAIGFLRVFWFFALLGYWAGILMLAGSCVSLVADTLFSYRQDGRDGWLQIGRLLIIVLAVTLGYVMRRGSWLFAEIIGDQHGSYHTKVGLRFQSLLRSTGCCSSSLTAASLTSVGGLAHWFIVESGTNDGLEVLRYGSLTGAVICWVLSLWCWRRLGSVESRSDYLEEQSNER